MHNESICVAKLALTVIGHARVDSRHIIDTDIHEQTTECTRRPASNGKSQAVIYAMGRNHVASCIVVNIVLTFTGKTILSFAVLRSLLFE